MPPRISLRIYFFSKFVRTYGTCMHHDKSFIHIITLFLPLMSFRLCYLTFFYDRVVSQELYHFDTDGSPRSPCCKRHLFGTVWNSHPTMEGTALGWVCWTASLLLKRSGNWGTTVVRCTGDCPSPCWSPTVARLECGVRWTDTLGGCPSCSFRGPQWDMLGVWGRACHRSCRILSSSEPLANRLDPTRQKCFGKRPGWKSRK